MTILVAILVLLSSGGAEPAQTQPGPESGADADAVLFQQDFEEADGLPEDFLVLSGNFEVVEQADGRVLRLDPEPLEAHGVMFGPVEQEDVALRARFRAAAARRRKPAFGLGLGGIAGTKLILNAPSGRLRILDDREVVAESAIEWAAGRWTYLELRIGPHQVTAGEAAWRIEGRAWVLDEEKKPVPLGAVAWIAEREPIPGAASLWGMPFAGKAVFFDDVVVARTKAGDAEE